MWCRSRIEAAMPHVEPMSGAALEPDIPVEKKRGVKSESDGGGGTIVAVKPREAFLRYFQTADELARRREGKCGVKSGSDGTRTRDLRRDRPAL
jgi:hypothetical protein